MNFCCEMTQYCEQYMVNFDKTQVDKILNNLNDTVEHWLQNKGTYSKSKASLFEPVVCKRSDTLGKVLETVYNSRVHRVYVVDDAKKPEFCISLSDIIGQFRF
jgi:Mg/Co/Ni transporter MgtE